MQVSTLSADPEAIRIVSFVSNQDSITILAQSSKPFGVCPICQSNSSSLHSYYVRQIADLPWHGVAIQMQLRTRKFRCRNSLCNRKVFCERLPKVAESYGRKTIRLNEAITLLAFALGGEAGARAAAGLNLTVSGDTLLRRIRQSGLKTPDIWQTPKVLGVDDFAFRRGQRYGTILVDLEKRKAIDLLPDREADTLCDWLTAHPGVEVISRDRSPVYADGARRGAPDAKQIADRFHLLMNLRTAIENLLCRKNPVLKQSYQTIMDGELEALRQKAAERQETVEAIKAKIKTTPSIYQKRGLEKRMRKRERFLKVKELQAKNYPIRQIALSLQMHRRTVRLYMKANDLPERKKSLRKNGLGTYLPYLEQRWAEGERNATRLGRELKAKGYSGTVSTVVHYLATWREVCPDRKETAEMVKVKLRRFATPSPKRTYWLIFKPRPTDESWADKYIKQLFKDAPDLKEAVELGQEFSRLMKSLK